MPDSAVVIESKDFVITKGEFDQLVKGSNEFEGRQMTPAQRRAIGEQFGRAFALESEARRRKLDQEPAVKLRIRNLVQQILSAELLREVRREYRRDDAKLRAHYETVKKDFDQPRVRHILVRTQGSSVAPKPGAPELSVEQARKRAIELRQRLVAGADFAAVAREASDDLGSGPKGGDAGFVPRGATAAAFEAAAFSLPIGQISQPVQTEYGFHILRVEERRPDSFERLKDVLANDLAHRELDGVVLKSYRLSEAFFGR